ncbi:MobF family relaxase [Thauera mechernichensis]|uniref:MobF family relaxase n=1 Tax=Thauera mechernichensis TaxID=82788 RepID=A0ABW3WKL7_9RHOO|nr:MobF family relaxase [Thauera mechernichensis]MDG3065994.1 MobF family relaxase [Thauera mechernichensis]
MMSISKPKTAGAAASYFSTHLREGAAEKGQVEDYYAAEGDPGKWVGGGLERVGLQAGEIRDGEFARVAAGISIGGEKLAQNAGDPDRRAGWDCTFSAPKGVSVVWALADDERRVAVEEAQEKAVHAALRMLEGKAFFARTGRDGEVAQQARLVAATFRHGTSREQDPQLHTHAFVMNLAVRDDGKVSSIDPRQMMRWQKAIGAAYRAELAENLRGLGYQVERDGDAFRVVGVSRAIEAEFSQRRQQITARLQELGLRDAKSSENVALETRRAKAIVGQLELERQWTARAEALGLTPEAAAELRGDEPGRPLELLKAGELLDKLTELDAVVDERKIYQAAAEAAQGAGGIRDATRLAETAKLLAVPLYDHVGGRTLYTTREMLAAEQSVLQIACARAQESAHRLSPQVVEKAITAMQAERSTGGAPFRLRAEQRDAVLALTTNQGATALMVGDAGTGKSTALAAVREAYLSQGFSVIGAALAGKAAAELQAGAGIQSSTIDRLLIDVDGGRTVLNSRTVIVLDEAGMIDSRKMARVSQLARDAGAKLILVGDHKQLQPVGAGATFRHLAAEQPVARLQQIGRQREQWAREAVREMSRGEAEVALSKFIDRGLVRVERTHAAAVRAAADRFVMDRGEVGAERVQAIGATNAQVRDLNSEIRERLKASGEIRDPQEIQVRDGKDPEKPAKLELAQAERIVITRNENRLGLKNGDFATVQWVSRNAVLLRLDRTGETIEVDPRKVAMRHGYAATTHRLQGATVERAIVLGSEHTSREMAYVQASRARGETRWIFSGEKVRKLEESAGVKPGSEQQMIERLRGALDAMSKSQQKASTLDFKVADPAPPSPSHIRSMEESLPQRGEGMAL